MEKLTQSYVHGTSDRPLIGDTIGVHLDRMARLSPERPALTPGSSDQVSRVDTSMSTTPSW